MDYYYEKYGIALKYPHAPLVKVRERGRTNNYPMELGWLRPMQRVAISKKKKRTLESPSSAQCRLESVRTTL